MTYIPSSIVVCSDFWIDFVISLVRLGELNMQVAGLGRVPRSQATIVLASHTPLHQCTSAASWQQHQQWYSSHSKPPVQWYKNTQHCTSRAMSCTGILLVHHHHWAQWAPWPDLVVNQLGAPCASTSDIANANFFRPKLAIYKNRLDPPLVHFLWISKEYCKKQFFSTEFSFWDTFFLFNEARLKNRKCLEIPFE